MIRTGAGATHGSDRVQAQLRVIGNASARKRASSSSTVWTQPAKATRQVGPSDLPSFTIAPSWSVGFCKRPLLWLEGRHQRLTVAFGVPPDVLNFSFACT